MTLFVIKIYNYITSKECYITFDDEFNTKVKTRMSEIRRKEIRNPNHKTLRGIGFIGQGEYKACGKAYSTWSGMFERAYSDRYHLKKPTYIGVTVGSEWHNYQNFAEWYEKHYNPETMQGWYLDKDILVPGNKTYAPEFCCFIPPSISSIFVNMVKSKKGLPRGVSEIDGGYQVAMQKYGKQNYIGYYKTIEEASSAYMKAKKDYLKEVSEKWRGILSDKICDAIKNYDISLL